MLVCFTWAEVWSDNCSEKSHQNYHWITMGSLFFHIVELLSACKHKILGQKFNQIIPDNYKSINNWWHSWQTIHAPIEVTWWHNMWLHSSARQTPFSLRHIKVLSYKLCNQTLSAFQIIWLLWMANCQGYRFKSAHNAPGCQMLQIFFRSVMVCVQRKARDWSNDVLENRLY